MEYVWQDVCSARSNSAIKRNEGLHDRATDLRDIDVLLRSVFKGSVSRSIAIISGVVYSKRNGRGIRPEV